MMTSSFLLIYFSPYAFPRHLLFLGLLGMVNGVLGEPGAKSKLLGWP